MLPTFCIGIDISKVTLDMAVLKDGILLLTHKIDNSEAAIKRFLASLTSNHGSTVDNSIYCAEHMGIYAKFLMDVFTAKNARLCLESPLRIKLSIGIQRTKTDAIDAINIAEYAHKNAATLKFWTPPRMPIQQLKALMTIRKKLIKMGVMLKNTKKLESYFLSENGRKDIGGYTNASFTALQADILTIERAMLDIINLDRNLHNLVQLITSVPYVGNIIAIEMVIITNEFKAFNCPKKFASYCGIAPFARSSGTSLSRKPMVSRIANKDMKVILHMAAIGSLKRKESRFRLYYDRKVKEGKHQMSVLNALKNKLVTVIFACVRDNKLYQEGK
jgi:transposase